MRYFGDCSPATWTYRSIDNLPPRVVIDANVLLDSVLIVDGAGIAVLHSLFHRKVALHTTAKAVAEARKTLLRVRGELPDITSLIDLAVLQSGVRRARR
jgi:predicted nucleic acid-binding protein